MDPIYGANTLHGPQILQMEAPKIKNGDIFAVATVSVQAVVINTNI